MQLKALSKRPSSEVLVAREMEPVVEPKKPAVGSGEPQEVSLSCLYPFSSPDEPFWHSLAWAEAPSSSAS